MRKINEFIDNTEYPYVLVFCKGHENLIPSSIQTDKIGNNFKITISDKHIMRGFLKILKNSSDVRAPSLLVGLLNK